MIVNDLNLEINIVKIEDNLITIDFQSDANLKLLIKDIKITDVDDKSIESDSLNHGVIDVVLNNDYITKTIDLKSDIKCYKKIVLSIKDRITDITHLIVFENN